MPHPCAIAPEHPGCIELYENIATCKTGFLQCLQTGDWHVIQQFLPGKNFGWPGLGGEVMMIRFAVAYLFVGLLFAGIRYLAKDERRPHVMLAVITGWPIFMVSTIGAGWDALLNRREE